MFGFLQKNRTGDDTVFHVHTFRCHHAEHVPDEAYVKEARRLGAGDIWFTDHAPFPGDPFGARMAYEELEEYLETLSELKRRYQDIRIHIGLETEYFPLFDAAGYYAHLRSLPEIEMLLLGQHMAQTSDAPTYSFSESKDYLAANEYKLLGQAIVQGIGSGYFDAVAHPDRIFRRCEGWDADMAAVSREIIEAAVKADLPLEMNICSAEWSGYAMPQFWELVPETARRLVGYDAHTLYELRSRHRDMFMLLETLDPAVCRVSGKIGRGELQRRLLRETTL
ncbi:MAG: PHP domain-containing protein [Oscillospiraceae bacterium]|nr:PHP domain-containing protein [Oscillospiraceae bacterium]